MKNRNILFLLIIILIAGNSCKTLMSYTNIVKCDFRMHSLKNPTLAGIDVQRIKNFSDLSMMQAGKLTTAYLGGNVPLAFQLNLEAKNPNASEAKMAQFDWILKIDDIQIATGTNQNEYIIPANEGTQMIPLNISVNLLDILNKETKNTLFNFGLNLADASEKPTRVSVQLKPTVYVSGIPITYPGYINLGTEFGG